MLKDLVRVLKRQLSWQEFELSQRCYGVASKERDQSHHQIRLLEETNLRLIATIRDMDQNIWNISQKAPEWGRIQPHIARLIEGMENRKQIENQRIQSLVMGEVIQSYNTDPKYLTGPSS